VDREIASGQEVPMTSKMIRSICGGLTLVALTAATALAQPADKRTFFTFSQPVAIPGATLPAGKYLFRLANPDTTRNTVQVLSADGRTSFGQFFFHMAQRTQPAPEPEVRFMETAAGMPAAVRTWWYPGESSGYEFVYPMEQAQRLAKGTGQPVLGTTAQGTSPAPQVAQVLPGGQQTAPPAATPATPTGPSQRGELAPPSLAIAEGQQARATLPRTGSLTPLVVLGGLLLLLTAALLRSWRLLRA
jgi:hypothetical protein